MFARINVGDIGEYFHLLLELVLQKSVVNTDHSLDVDARNHIFHQVLGVESRLYQIYTTDEPFLGGFAFLKTDVASRFKLGQQLSDRNLVDFS